MIHLSPLLRAGLGLSLGFLIIAPLTSCEKADAPTPVAQGNQPDAGSLAATSDPAADPAPSKATDGKEEKGKPLTLDLGEGVKMELVRIEAGEFLMGSPPQEAGRDDDEGQHEQKIDKPFYMGVYEVTRGQFHRFIIEKSYKTDAEKDGKGGWGFVDGNWKQDPKYSWRNPGFTQNDSHPVVNVSWSDAVAFCDWLSTKSGKKVRLPTEAQWEYACRAGTTTPFNTGNTISTAEANYDGNFPYGNGAKGVFRKQTTAVGAFKANAWGLHDMHGNVWEWCSSQFIVYPYRANDGREAMDGTASRVLRGGGWHGSPEHCRSAIRYGRSPGSRSGRVGFRVVLDF